MRTPLHADPDVDRARAYQDWILPRVSRTFALTIPRLPGPLRRVVTNAYLLCRIADTIEDESALSIEHKQHFHVFFRETVCGQADARAFARELAPLLLRDALDAERDLVSHTASVVAVTHTFSRRQRAALDRCLDVMSHGMPRYQRKASIHGLSNLAALNRYCYCVAGVVGEMLTSLFCDYSREIERHRERMMHLSPSFGQGLQMVNILKDFWEDYHRGVCWLPRNLFARAGIDLGRIDQDNWQPGFGETYAELIGIAHGHLRDGFEYTLTIPRHERGIRRFCLLALALALQTLQSIHDNPGFKSGGEVKVSRRVVGNTLLVTRVFAGSDRALRTWFGYLGRGLPGHALPAT